MTKTVRNIITEEPLFEYKIREKVLYVTRIFDSKIDQDSCLIVASIIEAGNFDKIRIKINPS